MTPPAADDPALEQARAWVRDDAAAPRPPWPESPDDAARLGWALKAACYETWNTAPARAERAAELLHDLAAARQSRSPVLHPLACWTRGIAELGAGRMAAALDALDAAAAAFAALGDIAPRGADAGAQADGAVGARPPRRGAAVCAGDAGAVRRQRRRALGRQDRAQPRHDAVPAGPPRRGVPPLPQRGAALCRRAGCRAVGAGRHRPGQRADLVVRLRRGASGQSARAPACRHARLHRAQRAGARIDRPARTQPRPATARAARTGCRVPAARAGRRPAATPGRGRDLAGRRLPGREPAARGGGAVRPRRRALRRAPHARRAGPRPAAARAGAGATRRVRPRPIRSRDGAASVRGAGQPRVGGTGRAAACRPRTEARARAHGAGWGAGRGAGLRCARAARLALRGGGAGG